MSGCNWEPIPVHLRPELLPAFRRVRQAPQAQDRRRSLLLPAHPRTTQPLLHHHLAGRLGHTRADRVIDRYPRRIIHPALCMPVREVPHRIADRLALLRPRAGPRLGPELSASPTPSPPPSLPAFPHPIHHHPPP